MQQILLNNNYLLLFFFYSQRYIAEQLCDRRPVARKCR